MDGPPSQKMKYSRTTTANKYRFQAHDKCKKCNEFHGNDILKGFCSVCFMNTFGKEKYFSIYPYSQSQYLSYDEIVSLNKYNDRNKYTEPLKKIGIVDGIANIISDYSEYPSDEYYYFLGRNSSRLHTQIPLNQWIARTKDNKKILSPLKMMINKTDYKQFANLLCELQPWMSIKDVLEIMDSIDKPAKTAGPSVF
eukprot:UN02034